MHLTAPPPYLHTYILTVTYPELPFAYTQVLLKLVVPWGTTMVGAEGENLGFEVSRSPENAFAAVKTAWFYTIITCILIHDTIYFSFLVFVADKYVNFIHVDSNAVTHATTIFYISMFLFKKICCACAETFLRHPKFSVIISEHSRQSHWIPDIVKCCVLYFVG